MGRLRCCCVLVALARSPAPRAVVREPPLQEQGRRSSGPRARAPHRAQAHSFCEKGPKKEKGVLVGADDDDDDDEDSEEEEAGAGGSLVELGSNIK
eukprot:2971475-Rhodomonas_salina.1